MDRHLSQALGTAALLSVVVLSSATAQDNGLQSQVVQPDSVIAGRTYGEWFAAWEQWLLSIPVSKHPLFDKGDCNTDQTGQVFFLGSKFCATTSPSCDPSKARRNCTVPGGKNLFFAIAGTSDSVADGSRRTINELRTVVQGLTDGAANLEVDLDGKSLKDLSAFRMQSPAYGFTVPDDNLFKAVGQNVAAGTYFPGVDDGVVVMLKPLSAGKHLLHFTGSFPAFGFVFDVTYHLTVSPPKKSPKKSPLEDRGARSTSFLH